jgi:hypothetical protein
MWTKNQWPLITSVTPCSLEDSNVSD